MATLENRTYQATRDALAANTLMLYFLTRDPQVQEIMLMSDAELEDAQIARADSETGSMQPTSFFMNAANSRFRQLEDANPDHRFTGPMHIGAVAEVILAERKHMDDVRRRLIPGLAKRAGKPCFRLREDATVADVHRVFNMLLDAAGA